MNFVHKKFQVALKLDEYLQQYTLLSDAEVAEAARLFTGTIVVCIDADSNECLKCGITPKILTFKELIQWASEQRQRKNHVFSEDVMNTRSWYEFHKLLGDTLVKYIFEKCHLFRPIMNDSNFLVQIAGIPIFLPPISQPRKRKLDRKLSLTNNRHKTITQQQQSTNEEYQPGCDAALNAEICKLGKRRRRPRRRGGSNVVNKPEIIELKRYDSLSAANTELDFTITARYMLYCNDIRERYSFGAHPVTMTNEPRLAFERMFNLDAGDERIRDSGLQIESIIVLLSDWRSRSKRCHLPSLLRRHCPVADVGDNIGQLTQAYCLTNLVDNTLKHVFRRALPAELLGEDNTDFILTAFRHFVVNAGRYDTTSVHQLIGGVKTKDCLWLQQVHDPTLRQYFLLRLAYWLFRYLMDIVRGCFYVTESEMFKNRLLFYRKPIWKALRRLGNAAFKKKCHLVRIERDYLKSESFYGPFALRWIPKANGVRSIICNRARPPQTTKQKIPGSVVTMNNEFRTILAIIQYLAQRNWQALGYTTYDADRRYQRYVQDQRRKQTSDSDVFYMVKADVGSCFDSIDQELLWSIIQKNLIESAPEFFCLQKYCLLRKTFSPEFTATEMIYRRYKYAVSPLDNPISLVNYFSRKRKAIVASGDVAGSASDNDSILVNAIGGPVVIPKNLVIERLRRLITRRALASKSGRYYMQTKGIAQGSSLSVILCNLYLAALEKQYLVPIIDANDLLMRYVDDLLYITPSLERAQRYWRTLTDGFPMFNCYLKLEKSVASFDGIFDGDKINCSNEVHHQSVPWCGLVFNPETLEVSVDVDRLKSRRMRDLIAVDFGCCPSSAIRKKLLSCLRSRVQRITFNPRVNTALRIRKNVRDLLRYLAKCFEAYVESYCSDPSVNVRDKRRLQDEEFVRQLTRCIYDAAIRCLPSKKHLQMSFVESVFLGALRGDVSTGFIQTAQSDVVSASSCMIPDADPR